MRWKVSREKISLSPHPDADSLEIGRVGAYQVVVRKGAHHEGEEVLFVPEKSVLTGALREEFEKYLSGPARDRVKAVLLRGELSMGLVAPLSLLDASAADERPLGDDVSDLLGITKYVPTIPEELRGDTYVTEATYARHDVMPFLAHEAEFRQGEDVVVTEKVHGAQCSCVLDASGAEVVMSKGLADEGIAFDPSCDNLYRRAARVEGVFDRLRLLRSRLTFEGVLSVQAVGEVVPCNAGFHYGFTSTSPALRVFRVVVSLIDRRVHVAYDDPTNSFRDIWVPVLFRGAYDRGDGTESASRVLARCRGGLEAVSGKGLHIREGCVVEPYVPRRCRSGNLVLKVINQKFRETGEELS